MDTDSPGNVSTCIISGFGNLHDFAVQHAGYDANPTFNVTGFSQLHDDGTGGVSDAVLQYLSLYLMLLC